MASQSRPSVRIPAQRCPISVVRVYVAGQLLDSPIARANVLCGVRPGQNAREWCGRSVASATIGGLRDASRPCQPAVGTGPDASPCACRSAVSDAGCHRLGRPRASSVTGAQRLGCRSCSRSGRPPKGERSTEPRFTDVRSGSSGNRSSISTVHWYVLGQQGSSEGRTAVGLAGCCRSPWHCTSSRLLTAIPVNWPLSRFRAKHIAGQPFLLAHMINHTTLVPGAPETFAPGTPLTLRDRRPIGSRLGRDLKTIKTWLNNCGFCARSSRMPPRPGVSAC